MDLIPYSALSRSSDLALQPGTRQGVYILLGMENREAFFKELESWFSERDEVSFVDIGITDKRGLGYIILEWADCLPDQLLLDILRNKDQIIDFTVYSREVR